MEGLSLMLVLLAVLRVYVVLLDVQGGVLSTAPEGARSRALDEVPLLLVKCTYLGRVVPHDFLPYALYIIYSNRDLFKNCK